MSSKSLSQILKILFQTGDISIFVLSFGILELRNRVTQNDVTLRVTNSKSKNKKFHFELLTRS